MAWNADATRLPYRMHSQYLHQMFLKNDLAEGRVLVGGAPVAISEIAVPLFVVGTEADHVAPWRSVYKIHLLNQGDITFALTSGGPNAEIVSEPGHPGRHFRIAHRSAGQAYVAPDAWVGQIAEREGSWWQDFAAWLHYNAGTEIAPPPMGSAQYPSLAEFARKLCAAEMTPVHHSIHAGRFVFQAHSAQF